METPHERRPASLAARMRSSFSARAPLCMLGCMPWSAMARMICSQSRRMKASPPMMVTSRTRRRASWLTTSRHSSVDSSSGRALPARDPQWMHFRLHASVISHTACMGWLRA